MKSTFVSISLLVALTLTACGASATPTPPPTTAPTAPATAAPADPTTEPAAEPATESAPTTAPTAEPTVAAEPTEAAPTEAPTAALTTEVTSTTALTTEATTEPTVTAASAMSATAEVTPTAESTVTVSETVSETVAITTATSTKLMPAPITNDEGGPRRLVGVGNYTSFGLDITLYSPSPALLDMVTVVRNEPEHFAPVQGQILGRMTAPVSPSPLRYAFDLPQIPTATFLDVDNDGTSDTGVQIFRLIVAANVNGTSYLEQLDQWQGSNSYLTDPTTGRITNGSLLVYAADDQQGFPNGFGADGILFTADDPAVQLPQGYTVVHFGPDGFTFDRSTEAGMDVLEPGSEQSSDFSTQGILESYNNLIDELAKRYSFTEFRKLDWEAMRAEYLPQVQQADTAFAQNEAAGIAIYANALHRLAQSIHDAHVQGVIARAVYPTAPLLADQLDNAPIATNLGAITLELNDGRIIVVAALPESPAAKAGWTFGTQIISVDGVSVTERLPSVIFNKATGTAEGIRLQQVNNLLKFPMPASGSEPTPVVVEAILPDATVTQTFTLTPTASPLPDPLERATHDMPISFKVTPGYGYVTWANFERPEVTIAVLREFLSAVKTAKPPGLILDLRGNSGGWDVQYFTMASYFFNAEHPVSIHWIDQDVYDAETGTLVAEPQFDYLISAPQPDLYYGGPVVILIDQNCASSCEFFTQFMQVNKRATIVAQYGTEGAGAAINRVNLPGGILFQYTKARAYYAGTKTLNLEAKGVTPDVRVTTTLEVVKSTLEGQDPVLATGVKVLGDVAAKAYVATLKLVPQPADSPITATYLYPEGWAATKVTDSVQYIAPDQTHLLAYSVKPISETDAFLAANLVTDPKQALVAIRTANGLEWSIYASADANFAHRTAVAQAEGQAYFISFVAFPTGMDALQEALLFPLIDAFSLK